MIRRPLAGVAGAWALASLAGCNLAPPYAPPHEVVPADYQGAGPWQLAHPDDRIARGAWWTAFGNPTLDALEARIPANPDLATALEAYEQGRELAAEAASGLYPQIAGGYAMSQNRQSPYRLFRSPTSTAPFVEPSVQVDGTASWEIDLWHRIGNETKARLAIAQGDAATLANVELSLRAELAHTYVELRGLDQTLALYDHTIAFYATGVSITRARLADKIGDLLDVERATTQLAAAQALHTETLSQRAVAEHAIAALVGVPASGFSLPPQADTPWRRPDIPTGVPSALLQRRPDIAAAERAMAAANAEIGVARAAFYPNMQLTGEAGILDSGFNLISLPNQFWSIGAAVTQPLFEGGLLRAELRFAKSAYRQTRDEYRATVLAAFRDVEDELTLTHLLAREAVQDATAEQAAGRAQSLAFELYRAGAGAYLDIIVAQVSSLQTGVTSLGTTTRADEASVDLVRSLGGGFDRATLPTKRQVRPFDPLAL